MTAIDPTAAARLLGALARAAGLPLHGADVPLTGSTAERLLQGAPCAIALAPHGYERTRIATVAVGVADPPERPSALTTAHWLSLFRCWSSEHRAPGSGGPGGRRIGGRPSAHGHAPGAQSIPRWGQ